MADDISASGANALLNSYEADSLQYFKITILFQKAVMKIIGVFVVLFFVMVEDVQSRIIRNAWVFAIFVLHLILAWGDGPWAAYSYIVGVFVWLLAMVPLYLIQGIGAGDAKLISVLAAGLQGFDSTLFWTGSLACAGLLALFKVVTKRSSEGIPLALAMWFGYATIFIHKGGNCHI